MYIYSKINYSLPIKKKQKKNDGKYFKKGSNAFKKRIESLLTQFLFFIPKKVILRNFHVYLRVERVPNPTNPPTPHPKAKGGGSECLREESKTETE